MISTTFRGSKSTSCDHNHHHMTIKNVLPEVHACVFCEMDLFIYLQCIKSLHCTDTPFFPNLQQYFQNLWHKIKIP